MRINEHFPAIQGEGATSGLPVYFMRLSGCNGTCPWCDSKYHTEYDEISIDDVSTLIRRSGLKDIVITGGEPMLQKEDVFTLIEKNPEYNFHLETNGSIYDERMKKFKTIACSPKRFFKNNIETLFNLSKLQNINFKFVYEPDHSKWWEDYVLKLGINKERIYIMPLGATRDEQIVNMPEVIDYCLINKYMFSSRLHVLAFNTKRGV